MPTLMNAPTPQAIGQAKMLADALRGGGVQPFMQPQSSGGGNAGLSSALGSLGTMFGNNMRSPEAQFTETTPGGMRTLPGEGW